VIGIVVVSHSEPLARAAVELASQMVSDDPPAMEVAAGSDGGLGTDATAIAAAIQRADEASDGTGVLVLMDLGSAVLSSEMALELADGIAGEVYLSRAPFVEGLVAAAVQAALGRSVSEVEREAVKAVGAKAEQLGPVDGSEAAAPSGTTHGSRRDEPTPTSSGDFVDVEVVNPQGLHARPAALLAKAAAELPVEVSVTNLETGAGPAAADSMLELMSLGARIGMTIRLSAEGPEAGSAVATLARLISDGLGESVDRG
jgi:phosphoenolpyruvate---glycerone phosphotransferase subunit DhaM